jgi:hypothetical protein
LHSNDETPCVCVRGLRDSAWAAASPLIMSLVDEQKAVLSPLKLLQATVVGELLHSDGVSS